MREPQRRRWRRRGAWRSHQTTRKRMPRQRVVTRLSSILPRVLPHGEYPAPRVAIFLMCLAPCLPSIPPDGALTSPSLGSIIRHGRNERRAGAPRTDTGECCARDLRDGAEVRRRRPRDPQSQTPGSRTGKDNLLVIMCCVDEQHNERSVRLHPVA